MSDIPPPILTHFRETLDFKRYNPVPDGYYLGVADIQGSTKAVAEGKYKIVNMVGAGVIAAIINLMPNKKTPFIFGGDGASFLIPPEFHAAAVRAMAATSLWAEQEWGLSLRVAMVPVSAIRAAGYDLCRADFAPSPYVTYAMFSGGGLDWADRVMKAGQYLIAPDPFAEKPDLKGLSCRWAPIPNRQGCILSLIVKPRNINLYNEFQEVFSDLMLLINKLDREGHPVPEVGPPLSWPRLGIDLEHRANNRPKWMLNLEMGVAWLVIKNNWNVGDFNTAHYKNTVSVNSDFRKYGDGLYLTLDCSDEMVGEIEACLEKALQKGVLDYGVHSQESALMTCIVPRPRQDDHFHFIDGAQGGYTQAATNMKKKRLASA